MLRQSWNKGLNLSAPLHINRVYSVFASCSITKSLSAVMQHSQLSVCQTKTAAVTDSRHRAGEEDDGKVEHFSSVKFSGGMKQWCTCRHQQTAGTVPLHSQHGFYIPSVQGERSGRYQQCFMKSTITLMCICEWKKCKYFRRRHFFTTQEVKHKRGSKHW